MFLLLLMSIFILAVNAGVYNTKTVTKVVGYDVDGTIVINGTDTTKTYTLTYWKDYD